MDLSDQELKSSNLVFMLQRKITQPSSQQLRILTELEENIPKLHRPRDDYKLAQITIYNGNSAFEGQLKGKSIAKQLTWNAQSMNTVLECLTGKREKVQIKFYPVINNSQQQPTYIFEIVCQISSGINLVLFSIQMKKPKIANPFLYMKDKFSSLQKTFRERQKRYKEKEEKLKAQLNQIQAVQKQIIYSSTTEITLMKKEFIKHINKEKAKIRKLMGIVRMVNPVSGMIESRDVAMTAQMPNPHMGRIAQNAAEQEQKIQKTHSMKKNRVVKKVDRQKYERSMPQKMEMDSYSQNKYFSADSNNYHDQQNNIWLDKKQQFNDKKFNKHRFAEDSSSSDQEPSDKGYQGYGRQNRREKTFLQQHQEKVQKQKRQNIHNSRDTGNDWEQLFNT